MTTAAPGTLNPRMLAAPLSAAASIKASHIELAPDAVRFAVGRTVGCVPLAGRAFDGEPLLCRRAALARALKAFRGSDVRLDRDENGLLLTAAARTVRVPAEEGLPPIPAVEVPDGAPLLTVPAPILADGVYRAAPHASRDETRPVLCTVAFMPNGQLVATDSYRLAAIALPEAAFDGDAPVLPEASTLVAVAHAARRAGGDVSMFAVDDALIVTFAGQTWKIPAQQDAYPHWERLLPNDADTVCEIDAAPADLGEISGLIADVSDRNDPLVLTATPQRTATIRSRGAVHVERDLGGVVFCREHPVEIGFNPKFVAELAASMTGRCRIKISTPLATVRIDAGRDLFLIMPIRLDG